MTLIASFQSQAKKIKLVAHNKTQLKSEQLQLCRTLRSLLTSQNKRAEISLPSLFVPPTATCAPLPHCLCEYLHVKGFFFFGCSEAVVCSPPPFLSHSLSISQCPHPIPTFHLNLLYSFTHSSCSAALSPAPTLCPTLLFSSW